MSSRVCLWKLQETSFQCQLLTCKHTLAALMKFKVVYNFLKSFVN